MRRFTATAALALVLVAGCASWEEIKENAASTEVGVAASEAVEDFLSGNWVGGIAGLAGVAGLVFFRRGVGRATVAAARAGAGLYRAARGVAAGASDATDSNPSSDGGSATP